MNPSQFRHPNWQQTTWQGHWANVDYLMTCVKSCPQIRHDFSFSGTINPGRIIEKIADIRDFVLKSPFGKCQFQIMDN